MAKEALKIKQAEKQNGECAITRKKLSPNLSLIDTHRALKRMDGGIYEGDNFKIVTPVAHMKKHKTFRVRDKKLEALKNIIDDREQVIKLRNKINNQILAYRRQTDQLGVKTLNWLEEQSKSIEKLLHDKDKILKNEMKNHKDNPIVKSSEKVKGLGFITLAYCLVYIDIEKAKHASSVWSYTGLHTPNHDRYKKQDNGKYNPGNKTLRCVLWNMANSQMKCKGSYRYIYDRVKTRLSISEKEVLTGIAGQTGRVLKKWKDTKPGHRHSAALRAVMKHFLADYWYVARTIAGLETNPLYAEAILGKEGHKTIAPEERGWIL